MPMAPELPEAAMVAQATQIDELLTPFGIEARFSPFMYGNPVRERNRSFFGRNNIIAESSKDFMRLE